MCPGKNYQHLCILIYIYTISFCLTDSDDLDRSPIVRDPQHCLLQKHMQEPYLKWCTSIRTQNLQFPGFAITWPHRIFPKAINRLHFCTSLSHSSHDCSFQTFQNLTFPQKIPANHSSQSLPTCRSTVLGSQGDCICGTRLCLDLKACQALAATAALKAFGPSSIGRGGSK